MKQIYKLNSFESGFNPDSPNGKGDQRITHNANTSILFDPLYAYNKISISLYARIARISLLKSLLNQMWLLAQHGGWQFLDCDALPNADCTWCEWISGYEERRVILITPGSEFGHGWWRIHQIKIELYNFWQDSNTELNHLGHRTKKIIVLKQFLIPIKRESFFIERLLFQLSLVLV